jgi:hypothetical protein
MAYRAGRVSEASFVVFQSINFFALAYIGGIATIGGALAGTFLAPGAPGSLWIRNAIGSDQVSQTLSGVGLIVTVITQPDGIANLVRNEREKRRLKAARAAFAQEAKAASAGGAPEPERVTSSSGSPGPDQGDRT